MSRVSGNPYCIIPENLAIQKLFLHQAQIDSIEIPDENVNRYVERYLNEWVQTAGSKEKLEEYRGMTFSQIREETFDMVKDNEIMNQVRKNLTQNIKITPAEVRHFFKGMPEDSLPLIPIQVEVELLAEHPRIRQEEIDRVKGELRDYTERINSGSTSFSLMSLLDFGFIVVFHIISGSFSPKPLDLWIVQSLGSTLDKISAFSFSLNAKNVSSCAFFPLGLYVISKSGDSAI